MDWLSFVLFNLKINFKDRLIHQLDERSSYFLTLYFSFTTLKLMQIWCVSWAVRNKTRRLVTSFPTCNNVC